MTALNKQALRDSAESTIGILENIAGFEPSDIDGDTVELRFENEDGCDTGCDVSIVDQCQKSADVIRALLDELEAAEKRLAELQSKSMRPVAWMRSDDITTFGPIFTKNENYAVEQWGDNSVALYASPVNFKLACFTDERNLKYINERGRETSLIWSERNSENGDVQLFRAAGIGVNGE